VLALLYHATLSCDDIQPGYDHEQHSTSVGSRANRLMTHSYSAWQPLTEGIPLV